MDQRQPTILIVEDEAIIQLYESDLAESVGFRALTASNADEAMRELEQSADIEVLLTDVEMPGSMDGLTLAARVHERWPDMRIVVASGGVGAQQVAMRTDGAAEFLSKPFTQHQFVSALQHPGGNCHAH